MTVKKKLIIVVIVVLALIGGGVLANTLFVTETPTPLPDDTVQTLSPDEITQTELEVFFSDELQEVNFCGTVYQTNRLEIDGVDFIQRIAEISKEESIICRNSLKSIPETSLRIKHKIKDDNSILIVLFDASNPQQKESPFTQSINLFKVDVRGIIYVQAAFDGSWHEIGIFR